MRRERKKDVDMISNIGSSFLTSTRARGMFGVSMYPNVITQSAEKWTETLEEDFFGVRNKRFRRGDYTQDDVMFVKNLVVLETVQQGRWGAFDERRRWPRRRRVFLLFGKASFNQGRDLPIDHGRLDVEGHVPPSCCRIPWLLRKHLANFPVSIIGLAKIDEVDRP